MCAVRLNAPLVASVAASLALGTALAANAGGYVAPVLEGVVAPIIETAPVGAWQGGYAGLTLGYAFGGDDDFGMRAPGGDAVKVGKLELSGANAGVRVGYRWQRDNWVFGPELGFEGGNIKDSFESDDGTLTANAKIKNVLALRLKTGYTVQPDLLVYGILGVARADVEYGATTLAGDQDMNYKKNGYIVGLGAEKQINERWSVTGEYEYANFGKQERPYDTGAGSVVTQATPDYHNVKLGLNFRF